MLSFFSSLNCNFFSVSLTSCNNIGAFFCHFFVVFLSPFSYDFLRWCLITRGKSMFFFTTCGHKIRNRGEIDDAFSFCIISRPRSSQSDETEQSNFYVRGCTPYIFFWNPFYFRVGFEHINFQARILQKNLPKLKIAQSVKRPNKTFPKISIFGRPKLKTNFPKSEFPGAPWAKKIAKGPKQATKCDYFQI